MANKNIITIIGATIAASLCCVTPLLAVLAGSSYLASSFSWLAPYHNYLVAFTVLVLLYAWYDKLKPNTEIECDCADVCFFTSKSFLAIVTFFTVVILSFPLWGSKVFDAAPTVESCESGTCDSNKTPPKKAPTITVGVNSLPVLQYMNKEAKNPTKYKQKGCSGSGFTAVDKLLFIARQEVDEMPPPVLKKMIDNDDDFVLLDVRELNQRASGEIYVSDSHALTYGKLAFNILNLIKDTNSVVVVYSKVGAISLFAAQTLKNLGYKHVYSLKGGLKAWATGYPYDTDFGAVVKNVEFE